MKKITVMGSDNQLHEVELTIKDIFKMQTKESKRTVVLGVAATALNVASIFVPKPAKAIVAGTGMVLTIATAISNANAVDHFTDQENIDQINAVVADAAARKGFEYCY